MHYTQSAINKDIFMVFREKTLKAVQQTKEKLAFKLKISFTKS